MWKYFLLGLLVGWLIEWSIVRYRRRDRGLSVPANVPTVAAGTPAEAGGDATTSGTGAGTVSGRIAMGAPGAVSTSSATLYSQASVYRQWDLEAIPGLGPRVGAALRDNGIDTFPKLAAMPASELDRLVRTAGADPQALGTAQWAELATLAAGHDWAGFAALAQRQGAGRAGAAVGSTPAAGVAT